MTNMAGSRLYPLLPINVHSVTNIMTGQNETELLSGLCALWKPVSVLSQRLFVREQTLLCNTTVQLQVDLYVLFEQHHQSDASSL